MKYPIEEDRFDLPNDDSADNYFSLVSIANKPNALRLLDRLQHHPKQVQIHILKNLLKAAARKLQSSAATSISKYDLGPDGRILYDLVRDYNKGFYKVLKAEGTLFSSLKQAEDYYLQEKDLLMKQGYNDSEAREILWSGIVALFGVR